MLSSHAILTDSSDPRESANPSTPAVRMQEAAKTFVGDDGTRVAAFENVELRVEPGEFVCILGPSGCGKTTVLRCLAGLEELTSGTAEVNGRVVDGVDRDLAVVFQRPVLLPWLSVADNVRLPLRVGGHGDGKSREEVRARVTELLDLVGLTGFESARPYTLSGGMQQRASIARALARGTDILMMDEPFGALDALTRQRMNYELVRIWQSSRSTIVLVTHDIHEALIMADRIVIMSHRPGHIVKEIRVDLPRPRSASSLNNNPERYLDLIKQVETCLGMEADA